MAVNPVISTGEQHWSPNNKQFTTIQTCWDKSKIGALKIFSFPPEEGPQFSRRRRRIGRFRSPCSRHRTPARARLVTLTGPSRRQVPELRVTGGASLRLEEAGGQKPAKPCFSRRGRASETRTVSFHLMLTQCSLMTQRRRHWEAPIATGRSQAPRRNPCEAVWPLLPPPCRRPARTQAGAACAQLCFWSLRPAAQSGRAAGSESPSRRFAGSGGDRRSSETSGRRDCAGPASMRRAGAGCRCRSQRDRASRRPPGLWPRR